MKKVIVAEAEYARNPQIGIVFGDKIGFADGTYKTIKELEEGHKNRELQFYTMEEWVDLIWSEPIID
jgi:hypothetical protein